MSNIQKTLDSLQPHVIGIRFIKMEPVVDIVLNEGWLLPEDSNIVKTKGEEKLNGLDYYMIYSDTVGLDKLLEYVDRTIKYNIEREKKHELLKLKVNELKEVFKKNTLGKLQGLKFTFGEEEFLTNMNDIDMVDEIKPVVRPTPMTAPIEETFIEETIPELPIETDVVTYLDENKQPIEMTEEEKEIAMEEARGERNRQILEARKLKQDSKPSKKIELPPRKAPAMVTEMNYKADCDCGPNQACNKCMDTQDY